MQNLETLNLMVVDILNRSQAVQTHRIFCIRFSSIVTLHGTIALEVGWFTCIGSFGPASRHKVRPNSSCVMSVNRFE